MSILRRVRTEELKAIRRKFGDRGGGATSATMPCAHARMDAATPSRLSTRTTMC